MLNNSDDNFIEFFLLFDSTNVVPRRERWRSKVVSTGIRHTRGFQSGYRMSEPYFHKLVNILRNNIFIDENQSMQSSSVMVLSHQR